MKKLNFICVLLIIFMLPVCAESYFKIKLGNQLSDISYSAFMKDNRVYVSIRSLCEELGIPVFWDEQKKEVCVDIYNKKIPVSGKTEYKSDGVIPDEETAYQIGKIILEKYVGRELEYEAEDRIFQLDVTYLENENAWRIVQVFRHKNPNAGGSLDWPELIYLKLNKNTGEVMYINTYGEYSRMTQ